MGRADPRQLRVCVHDHAGRAGATNRGKGLAGERPIGVARSARDRVIAGVLFTCSRSDLGRDRDVSARGEHGRYVMASWRAPRASYLSTPLTPYSNVVYVDFAPSSSRDSSLSLFVRIPWTASPRRFCESLRPSLQTHFSLSFYVWLYRFVSLIISYFISRTQWPAS